MNVMTKPAANEVLLTRDLKASRERVFAAWVDPEQAARWWVPQDCTLISCKMDVREGGGWFREMRWGDRGVIKKWGVYREIVSPERLVFTYNSQNADGSVDPETVVTVTFEDLGGRTRLTLRHAGFWSEQAAIGHTGGWTGALNRFEDFMTA